MSELEAKELLKDSGVEVAESRIVRDEHDVAAALAELGGRIALKVSASEILHKSERGALALGLDSVETALRAYDRLSALAAACGGIVVAERMVPAGVELLVTATAEAVVPAVVVGLGGVWTETLADVAIVPLPAGAARIERALRKLRGAPVLLGGRGQPAADVGAASRLAQRTGELLLEASLEVIELNPVLVGERGAVAVDALVRGHGRAVAAPTDGEQREAVRFMT